MFFFHSLLEHKFDFLPVQPSMNLVATALICSCVWRWWADWSRDSTQFEVFTLRPSPQCHSLLKRFKHKVITALEVDLNLHLAVFFW
jgi:hypothetical protein